MQVVTMAETKEQAEAIGKRLLEGKLAACIQIEGPMSSSYWRQGKIETAEEWRCTIKTTIEKYDQVEQSIRSIHPYEEPEILAFRIEAGSQTYLKWLEDNVR
jgi:periplasmic divalent cation tolerance protein